MLTATSRRAGSDRKRRVNEAMTARAEALAGARGKAASIVNRAEADRLSRVARASGEADAFRAQLAARAPYPGLTDHRLYWETIASVMAARSKVVLDSDQSPRQRHLIVPNLLIPTLGLAPVLRSAQGTALDRGSSP